MLYAFMFVIALASRTEQHLAFPINYCNVAMACIHDSRPVCASSMDGCSRRSFLDQCDMFEYNCDYGTHFEMVACEDPIFNGDSTEAKDIQGSLMHRMPLNEYFYSIYKMEQDSSEIDNEVTATEATKIITSTSGQPAQLLKEFTKQTNEHRTTCFSHCGRPQSWGTTAQGETRDFFRILQDYSR